MIEYSVNKEKRTIVAFIKFGYDENTFKGSRWIFDGIYDALMSLQHRDFREKHNKTYHKLYSKMTFPPVISAKAKCNPEDEWDEEYGKYLARQRLMEKIRNYRSNSYKIIADLNDQIKNIVM